MLEWRENLLWCGNHILADVVRFGPGDFRLDLRGWEGFCICDFSYPTLRDGKNAAECWARCRDAPAAARAAAADAYGDEYGITDDDIPF